MEKVRFGIIGLGNMGSGHAKYLTADEIASNLLEKRTLLNEDLEGYSIVG